MHEEFIKRSGEIKNIKYLFKITRPKQWLKNLLILIPPIISGSIIKWTFNDVKQTILVLIIFTLASVNVYVLNDIIDAPIDRLSQNRKNRPIAAGEISLNVAKIFLLFLMILLFVFLINMSFKIKCIISGYILLNIIYSILLKKIAYWEMFSISIGFLLRAIAGTSLVDKVPSQEFYAIVFFGSLLVISGKRLSEFNNPPESHRSILKNYKLKNIEGIINLSLVLMTGAYCLFISSTFFSNVSLISNFFVYFSLLPFLAIIFNIHSIAISGKLENPESQLFTNKNLIFNILIWISVFLLGTRNW